VVTLAGALSASEGPAGTPGGSSLAASPAGPDSAAVRTALDLVAMLADEAWLGARPSRVPLPEAHEQATVWRREACGAWRRVALAGAARSALEGGASTKPARQ
jgi:hypothetical protein